MMISSSETIYKEDKTGPRKQDRSKDRVLKDTIREFMCFRHHRPNRYFLSSTTKKGIDCPTNTVSVTYFIHQDIMVDGIERSRLVERPIKHLMRFKRV